MTDKIRANDVLSDAEEVGSIHRETWYEHVIRTFPDFAKAMTAVILTAVGVVVCIILIFSSNPSLNDLRTGAWTLFSALIGGCAGFLYGKSLSTE